MPAIMVHDFFGRDTLARNPQAIGLRVSWDPVTEAPSAEVPDANGAPATEAPGATATQALPFATCTERETAFAFLLGNQGPDPFFYTALVPQTLQTGRLGNLMHREQAARQFVAFKDAIERTPENVRDRAQAYAHGFLCHYALDRTMHPFIYAQQFALCDAGVDGLSRRNNHEVHALIESDLDEMMLFVKTGRTIAAYRSTDHILRAAPETLDAVSPLFTSVVHDVWHRDVPPGFFATAVRCFRLGQHGLYSPTGRKRAVLGTLEEAVRPYSFLRAMSLRAIEADTCAFDNRDHAKWTDPFTNEASTEGFWDLYYRASAYADELIAAFDDSAFGLQVARRLTDDRNYSGDPTG